MVGRAEKIEKARTLISQAATEGNLDYALSMLMTEAEIETGDVAGQFFSEFDDAYDHWQNLSIAERSTLLNRYLDVEAVYIGA